MTQPVIDTLQVSNVLKNTGMAPEQAEGVARVLGAELGAHVVVQKDLESGFQGVRTDLGAKIHEVDTKVDVLRAELTGRMDGMDRKIEALNWKLTFIVGGFGLLLSVLTVASGMGLFERAPPSPQSYSITAPPSPSTPPVSAPVATPPASP